VQADIELTLTIRESPDGVQIPDFFEQSLSHGEL
jgi:hypothetical protein